MKKFIFLAIALAILLTPAMGAGKIRPADLNYSQDFSSMLMDEDANITLDRGYIFNLQTDGYVNVAAYGATGDDVSDDTTAIQAAIAAAKAINYKIIFPAGEFYVSDELVLDWQHATIEGMSPRSTKIIRTDGGDVIDIQASSVKVSNLGFVGDTSRLVTGINISTGGYNQVIDRCLFYQLDQAIYANNASGLVWDPTIRDCYIQDCADGIVLKRGVWQFLIDSCQIFFTTSGFGIDLGQAGYPIGAGKIVSTTVEFNDGQAGIRASDVWGLSIDSCYFEGNKNYHVYVDGGSQAVDVTGCYINNGINATRAGHGIYNNGGNVTVDQNIFNQFNGSSKYGAYTTWTYGAWTWVGDNWQIGHDSTNMINWNIGDVRSTNLRRAATQANSSASDVPGMVTDFNELLLVLKNAGIVATS